MTTSVPPFDVRASAGSMYSPFITLVVMMTLSHISPQVSAEIAPAASSIDE